MGDTTMSIGKHLSIFILSRGLSIGTEKSRFTYTATLKRFGIIPGSWVPIIIYYVKFRQRKGGTVL